MRLATIAGTALLMTTALATPAHAGGHYRCAIGSVTPAGDEYNLDAQICDGSGAFLVDVTITRGPAAGDYRCRMVMHFPLTDSIIGDGCRPI
ncbi:hypothetical protein DP939_04770 [Spongiactinospora rosea]|uniref:Uncharacterized protein n=1 Tax=Spongiactinospora rosea TaxID=2248750 RepID=A0A366M8Q8_9ACTN|nr:hypothetical protein [Spongiactinospora rosea]RBQ21984.1 hypothetical protein DP939_04770 [Spongiactinospora rosea]